MNVIGNSMSVSNYGCRFSVLAVPKQPEMFMMNMQVYDVVPQPVGPMSGEQPLTVVWCAVFNVKGARNPG